MLRADENHPFQVMQGDFKKSYSDAFLSGRVEKCAPLPTSFAFSGDEVSSSLLKSMPSPLVRASDLLSSLNEASTKSTSCTSHPTEVSSQANFLRSVGEGFTTTSEGGPSESLSAETVHLKKVVHFEESLMKGVCPRLSDSCGLSVSDASCSEGSTQRGAVWNASIQTTTDTVTDERSTDALHRTRAEGEGSEDGGTLRNVQCPLPPPPRSVPLAFSSEQTSADSGDPLGGWRDLLHHHPPSFFDPSTVGHTPSTVVFPSGRQTEVEDEIVKERAIRDYLRRLMIFSRGYDDPSFFASGVPLNGSLGKQRSLSSAAASSRSPASLRFEDGLYNGAAMGQLIQTIIMWRKLEPTLAHQWTPHTIPVPTPSFSVFLTSMPLLPPHRFPQSISEVRENYEAFIEFLATEDGGEKDGVLKVSADILQKIDVEEIYTHHRRVPLLELFTLLIREHLPPPEQIPLFMRILSHQLPVDACLGSFSTVTREGWSTSMKETSLENLSVEKEKKEAQECGACSSSSSRVPLVQRQLSTYAAYERFLCQFLVAHFALPDPETYTLPSDECLVPGPLQANFLFSPSSSLPHRSSAPFSSSSVAPHLSSLFLAVEEPFVPRHSPPLALFVPSVFPFLTNGVSLLKLAATLRPPSSVHAARKRGTNRVQSQQSPTVSPHVLSSWRQSCLNPKTPVRCQLNIAIALQWLLTDEKGRLIVPEKDFGLAHRDDDFLTTSGFTRTFLSEEDPAGGKSNTLFSYGSATRSKSILGDFHPTISRMANCIYQGDRLCLLKVLWRAVEFHRRASLARRSANHVTFTPVHGAPTDVKQMSSARQSANAKMSSTSPKDGSPIALKAAKKPLWFTSASTSMHTLPSALKVEKELQQGFGSSSRSDRAPRHHSSQGKTEEQSYPRSHSAVRRGECGRQKGSSRRRTESVRRRENFLTRQEAQVTSVEARLQKQVEVGSSVHVECAESLSSRSIAAHEVKELKDWFLSVMGGPRFYYEARDNSFRIQGSDFELPIPAIPRPLTASPSPKCLMLSDGVVLAQLIRILERRRCDALDCVKPAIQKAAKRFNISRCIRFLREDCGVSSSLLWILEEPLLDGDTHAVLSLLKILKKHYNRYGPLRTVDILKNE